MVSRLQGKEGLPIRTFDSLMEGCITGSPAAQTGTALPDMFTISHSLSAQAYMTRETFTVYVQLLVATCKPTADRKLLLLTDGHDSRFSLDMVFVIR